MALSRPLAIDLYGGLGGWSEGLIAAGWYVVGFDLEDMRKLLGEPPLEQHSLVIQDVLTLHGSQFKHAGLIVGSSPCTKYSYMAMPWTRSKALAAWYRDPDHPERLTELNALYDAQFRIQREASEAAGRHIPMVCENVRGAIPWVGRSRWNAGSMYLWGDVPALMPPHKVVKVQSFRFDGSGRSFQSASVRRTEPGLGARFTSRDCGVERQRWFNDGPRTPDSLASSSSRSPARKAASARIARIPFQLAYWIGRYAATPAPQRMEPVR